MSLTALVILAVLLLTIAFDIWAWQRADVPTITRETRRFLDHYGVGALALALAVGFVLGHLFWTPTL